MGFFTRRPEPLLPPDLGRHLAAYGQDLFAPQQFAPGEIPSLSSPAMKATLALSKMQLLPRDAATTERALDEIVAAAHSTGGWAVYGAYPAVHAFLPDQARSPKALALLDARLQFLRRNQPPGWRQQLTPYDVARYRELYPGEV